MRSSATSTRAADPWAKLYELESGARGRTANRRGRGRPARAVARHKKTVELTDTELKGLVELQTLLAERLDGVSRGQVVGVAIWALTQQLRSGRKGELRLPENVASWTDLLAHLEG